MHVDKKEIEENRQILYRLQIALRSNFIVNVIAKIVKVAHCYKKEKSRVDACVV